MYIQDKNNPNAFGSWLLEPIVASGITNIIPISTKVNDNVRDVVLIVNSHEQWEMESSKITLDIDLSTTYNNGFDLM